MYLEIKDEALARELIESGDAREIDISMEECDAQITYELYDSEKYDNLTDEQCEKVKRRLLGWVPYKLNWEDFCEQISIYVEDEVEKLYGE